MFDIGFWEMCIIGVVGLLVIGPERLPGVARTVGKYVGKAQRMVASVKSDINREIESGELRDLIGEQRKQIEQLQSVVNDTRDDIETSTRDTATLAEKSWAESLARQKAAEEETQNELPQQADAESPGDSENKKSA